MSTSKSQRFGIWVIAIVLAIGTLAGFAAMILTPSNDASDQKKAQEAYQKQVEEAAKANKPLKGYSATAFDANSVKKLKVETLKQGTGKAAKADSTVTANYFGWDASGKIFDSTNKNGTTTPIDFGLSQVITGWTEGLTGVKEGSTVKLTIPADKAYGNTDQGNGQPVGPLVFVVELKKVK